MLHGMQKVRGSNPLSSTGFPDLYSIAKRQAKSLTALGVLASSFVVDGFERVSESATQAEET
jgi:hypothetical protein